MLTAQDLSKAYAGRQAVDRVSLSVERGQTLGLLGPNGAGKTTTVAMICGLVRPDAGAVWIGGERLAGDAAAAKRRIGLAPQDLALYEELPAMANLRLFGALYGLTGARLQQRCDEVLALVGLADRAGDKPAGFSGGMKRRLNIACALVHDPDLLILDEPTTGVDPQSRNAIFDNLETLKARGKSLIYTTHYMEEAERLCDRILVMDHGRVIADDSLPGLLGLLPAKGTLELTVRGQVDLPALQQATGAERASQVQGELLLGVADVAAAAGAALAWLAANGHEVGAIRSGRATLEDVFLALTGRQLRD